MKKTFRKFNVVDTKYFIARDGKSEYSIVIREQASPAEIHACEELNWIIQMATGINLPVVYGKAKDPYFSVGNTDYVANNENFSCDSYGRNSFCLKTIEKNIYVTSKDYSGLIFGVYRLMEILAGYKYYSKTEIKVNSNIVFKELDIIDQPDFQNRFIFNYDTSNDIDNRTRLFLNGSGDVPVEYGEGGWWSSLHDTSLTGQLIQQEIYREKYPDWFYGSNGNKSSTRPQLCYTKALYDRDEYEKGDWSEENYADGHHGLFWTLLYNLINNYIIKEPNKSLFQLGMTDNREYCDCERCKRDVEKYTKSGVAIRFANAVADEVEKWRQENCPEREIYITMFAYLTIVDPPVKKIKGKYEAIDKSVIARDNVLIRYAPIDDYYMYPLMDEIHNVNAYNALNGWAAVAKHFAVWDYRIDFNSVIAPFPSWLSADDNIKTYRKLGFKDIFQQSCRTTTGTAFVDMDNWVRSKLVWNADLEYEKLASEFIEQYYKEGKNSIIKYRQYLTNHYIELYEKGIYKGHSHDGLFNKKYFSHDNIIEIENIFKEGYESIKYLEKENIERYNIIKDRLDVESLFYRFMKILAYNREYTVNEINDEYEEFSRIRKLGKVKALVSTFGYVYDDLKIIELVCKK